MFVPHWIYLSILLFLAIAVPLVIIRVLQRTFASKQGAVGNRGCLVFGGFMLLFVAIGLSLAFYFPKTEIRTIAEDGVVTSRTVILYSPSEFVTKHSLAGFSFDSVYVANETDRTLELCPQSDSGADTLSLAPGAVVALAKTGASDYNYDFAPQSPK